MGFWHTDPGAPGAGRLPFNSLNGIPDQGAVRRPDGGELSTPLMGFPPEEPPPDSRTSTLSTPLMGFTLYRII